jgi:hypothetical protein
MVFRPIWLSGARRPDAERTATQTDRPIKDDRTPNRAADRRPVQGQYAAPIRPRRCFSPPLANTTARPFSAATFDSDHDCALWQPING